MTMSYALQLIADRLRSKNIHVQGTKSPGEIIALIPTKLALYHVTIMATWPHQELIIRAKMPFAAPEGRIVQTMELIVRANLGFQQGRFDLDLASGEIHAHLGTHLSISGFGDGGVERAISLVLEVADDWHPAISRVLFEDGDPKAEAVLAADVVRLRKEAGRLAARGYADMPEEKEFGWPTEE